MKPEIQLNNGRYFSFETLNVEVIDIELVAAVLSKAPRFGGHTIRFLSVAEHCVAASKIVAPGFEMEALLHDCAETVLGDMPTPIKRILPDYSALLAKVEAKLHPQFGIPVAMSPEVRHADLVCLATEREYLKTKTTEQGGSWAILEGIDPDWRIAPRCLSPRKAEQLFLNRYKELCDAERQKVAA
jgi:uncharacterized protein